MGKILPLSAKNSGSFHSARPALNFLGRVAFFCRLNGKKQEVDSYENEKTACGRFVGCHGSRQNARMAFSVSAAPEDSLVASYDFSTDEQWTLTGATISDGKLIVNSDATNNAAISNPLAGQTNTGGFSVVLQIDSMGTDQYDRSTNAVDFGLMGFKNTTGAESSSLFSIEGDGISVRYNDWNADNTDSNFYDVVSTTGYPSCYNYLAMSMTDGAQFVVTVQNDTISFYLNGELVITTTPTLTVNHDTGVVTNDYVRSLNYFIIGCASWQWACNMTVSSAAIYNEALTAEEVAELCGVTPPAEVDVTYDLTTDEGRQGWSGYTASNYGATYAEGNNTITEGENGVTFTQAGLNSYSIANPLKDKVTDGFSITVNATISEKQALTQYEGFFGFNQHTGWQYWQASNDGTTLQSNSDLAYVDWTKQMPGNNPFYYGVVGTAQDAMRKVEYTISVDEAGARIYLNGELVATRTEENSDYVSAVTLGAANRLDWFNLGFNAGNGATWGWNNTLMTVSSVSFSTTTYEEKQAQEIADSLEVTMLGRQLGTTGKGEQGVRFVAGIDESVVTNEAVDAIGWLYQTGEQVSESAASVPLTYVTSASTFDPNATGYAFTLVSTEATEDQNVAVLPCVQVNGYWFAYNGIYGNYSQVESADIVAQVDANDFAFSAA